ncbi:MAG TPA: recombinase family protein [Acidobacteriaceae bacterium]|nr:recombinase family protein [Acidobacteriaceae bacterium]
MSGFVAYYRVSTDKQGQSGLGLEAQRETILRFVGSNPLAAEFTEVESGKSHTNRPQLLTALEMCKRKKLTLVLAKLDRLGRNLAFIASLLESGVEFVCCDNPHANKMTLQMLSVFAEFEREQTSVRTKAALAAAKARGTQLGNPRWQESLDSARTAKNPIKPAPQVVEMMRQYRADGLTLRAIADKLNGLGLRTPKGFKWYAATVANAMEAS